MPPRRLTGSDRAIQHPAMRSAGPRLIRPSLRTCPTDSTPSQLAHEPTWSARHGPADQEAAIELVDGGRMGLAGPRFARLHASLAERPLEWAWQDSPATPPARSERLDAGTAHAGGSAVRLWLGSIMFALLAAGVIAAVATVQSGRPLPFETWARRDLMQGAGDLAGGTSAHAMGAGRFASPPMVGREFVVAAPGPTAERDPADAALAWDPGRDAPEVDVAALGPILASAAAAAKLTAEWPGPLTAVQTVPASRSERLPLEPPRPVFKPTLVSSLQTERTAGPRSRP
jgi:hypothetical protein